MAKSVTHSATKIEDLKIDLANLLKKSDDSYYLFLNIVDQTVLGAKYRAKINYPEESGTSSHEKLEQFAKNLVEVAIEGDKFYALRAAVDKYKK